MAKGQESGTPRLRLRCGRELNVPSLQPLAARCCASLSALHWLPLLAQPHAGATTSFKALYHSPSQRATTPYSSIALNNHIITTPR